MSIKDALHKEFVINRNSKDDEHYLSLMATLLNNLPISPKERILIIDTLRVKHEGRNLSAGQKSLIAGIYYNKVG